MGRRRTQFNNGHSCTLPFLSNAQKRLKGLRFQTGERDTCALHHSNDNTRRSRAPLKIHTGTTLPVYKNSWGTILR